VFLWLFELVGTLKGESIIFPAIWMTITYHRITLSALSNLILLLKSIKDYIPFMSHALEMSKIKAQRGIK
jgi:hypothetical protein